MCVWWNILLQQRDREFMICVSYMELYNENVVDLLVDSGEHLEVREDMVNTRALAWNDGLFASIINEVESHLGTSLAGAVSHLVLREVINECPIVVCCLN